VTGYKHKNFSIKPYLTGLFLALASLGAMAQENPTAAPDAKTHPVAADVNGVKILRKEVDLVYGRQAAPGLSSEQVMARKRAILAELVRAEVLAQKAAENKLDQSPDFELEIQLTRRSMLASKIEQLILGAATRVTPQQAQDFVSINPRLFAERQLLTLEVMNLTTPDQGLLDRLDQASNEGAGLEKVERLIREARGESQRKVMQNSSDRLPADLFKALSSKPYKPVVIKFSDNPQRGLVMLLKSATPSPLSGNEAVAVAGNLLQNRQLQSTRLNSINALVNGAKVEYFGAFTGVQAGGESSLEADMVAGSIHSAPISRTRKLAIAGGLAAATSLLVVLLLASWRFWTGNSHRSAAPAWLQRMPLIGRLVPPLQAGAALAQALASSSGRSGQGDAAWHGKLLALLFLAGCMGLLWLQSVAAWNRLPHWVTASAGAVGLAFGLLLAWVWLRSRLAELGKDRRWLPLPILGLLTLGASAAGIMLS
jgi:EpsD family peptidyl-prolyl cis-trans isomerase